MHLIHSLVSVLLVATASAVPLQTQGIKWGPCGFNGTLPLVCGNLSVPLDYTNKGSNEKLTLSLVKASALKKPFKGSILFNFGGPGGDGLQNMADTAALLRKMTGGHHDLISFDPRGTGNTLKYSCYNTQIERSISQSRLGNQLAGSSETALGRLWAGSKVLSDTCQEQMEKKGTLVGTAFTARDMMQIVDALGEDGMLRYWGLSYGTVLGATVASMFPDRMDRVILDGVENPHQYYHSFETEMFTDTEKVFEGFLSGCLAAPENCGLASKNATTESLGKAMSDLFEHLRHHPIPFEDSLIDYTLVKSGIFLQLYNPGNWPMMASLLNGLLTGNVTAEADTWNALLNGPSAIEAEALPGIKCSDKFFRPTFSELSQSADEMNKTMKWFGDIPSTPFAQCARWGAEAKERYEGDFHAQTKNPVLVIGNTYDPVTPLVSAHNVSSGFDGSVVLQQNSYGHTSLSQPSSCTISYTQNYFVNGTLPTAGTICQPDKPLFYEA